MKSNIILILLIVFSINVTAQCDATILSSQSTVAVDNSGADTPVTLLFNNEYDVLSTFNISDSYTIRAGTGSGFLTVRNVTDNSVIASGNISVNFTATTTQVEVHYFASNACDGTFAVSNITVQNNTAASTNVWDGSSNSNWNDSDNWSVGTVPNSTTNVTIPNVTNKPIISASTNIEVNNLTIENSSSLILSSNSSLTVNGTFANSSTPSSFLMNSSSSF
ncbi:hypothetical protein BTO18_07845, partial [Polaribacter porphyrae]